jgi:hypothetical protein
VFKSCTSCAAVWAAEGIRGWQLLDVHGVLVVLAPRPAAHRAGAVKNMPWQHLWGEQMWPHYWVYRQFWLARQTSEQQGEHMTALLAVCYSLSQLVLQLVCHLSRASVGST